MLHLIRKWVNNLIERRRRKQTLEIIKKAKQAYLDHKSPFMCVCFFFVEYSFCCYDDIVREIPEFKPSTFGLYVGEIKGCWWKISDRESRIKAFDKLIEIYSK
jgi:hypothetical protein